LNRYRPSSKHGRIAREGGKKGGGEGSFVRRGKVGKNDREPNKASWKKEKSLLNHGPFAIGKAPRKTMINAMLRRGRKRKRGKGRSAAGASGKMSGGWWE